MDYWIPFGAETDDVIAAGAGKDAAGIVIGVAIGAGAGLLEDLGVVRRLARHRVAEHAAAAVLVGAEHVARAPAGHRLAVDIDGQFRGAVVAQVAVAAGGAAVATLPVDRRHRDGQVEAVDEADAEHLRTEPQAPVWHEPFPSRSKSHPVRPQMRPTHPTGAVNTTDSPGFNGNPPPLKLFPGVIPGHIVVLQ
ncbi:hypothetical protein B296_00025368 [Ensete ventricosum]|uniref:Uncharacterized protein n=1 Tax=Ensete ventricosum TaxID=4639 RepID=A0A427AGH7_ENSVE|nr:hypothetical protein B296_00025368 [Ensete ventricosum]